MRKGGSVSMKARGHHAYVRDGAVVVEFYNFGEDVTYEYASMLVFAGEDKERLATALNIAPPREAEAIVVAIASAFDTMWDVKAFAEANRLAFVEETDFQP